MHRILTLSFIALLLFGCDWREFDDLGGTATVQVLDAPEQYSGAMFGQVATHLLDAQGRKVPGLLLVGGQGAGPFALVDFREGEIEISSLFFEMSHAFTVESLVPMPMLGGNYRFVASSLSSVYLFTLSETATGFSLGLQKTTTLDGIADFGRDILPLGEPFDGSFAYASVDRVYLEMSDATDLVQLELDQLELPPTNTAVLNVPIMGRLSHDGSELLAVGGTSSDSSHWEVLFVDLYDPLNRVSLTGSDSFPGGTVQTLTFAELNGDGINDLLVGAGERIYLFMSDVNRVGLPYSAEPTWVLESAGRSLGQLIAVGDLNGNSQLEILSADVTYSSGSGSGTLGIVSIFTTDFSGHPAGVPVLPVLELVAQSEEKKFGSSLVTLPTPQMPGRDELFVGGENSSYLFYITGLEGDDSPAADPRP